MFLTLVPRYSNLFQAQPLAKTEDYGWQWADVDNLIFDVYITSHPQVEPGKKDADGDVAEVEFHCFLLKVIAI